MTVTNTKYYPDLPFEEYLKMPGVSFSSLKEKVVTPTTGMMLGTRVHSYLLEPSKYDWKQAELVIPMATAIRTRLGPAFKYLQKEIAFTADFIHNNMRLRYKGRVDMLVPGALVVDLKVLAGAIAPAIDFFGYDNQVSGYCLATGASTAIIVGYNKGKKTPRPQDAVEVFPIIPAAAFWEYQTVRLGEPVHDKVTQLLNHNI